MLVPPYLECLHRQRLFARSQNTGKALDIGAPEALHFDAEIGLKIISLSKKASTFT
jgi:hypothetical protein